MADRDERSGTILVTGAAGKTGRAVLRALRRRGAAARALVRRAAQEEAVRDAGAREVVAGDFLDPPAVARAAEGTAAIYHICPNVSPDEVAIGRTVLAAARAAGVGRFVFHSVLHPQAEAMPHHWRKLRVEEQLFESGLPFTVLQPAAYMQNVLAHWRAVVEDGVYPVPYRVDTRLAAVDLEDVAEVAARVLTEGGHLGATYELCGETLSPAQTAAILGGVMDRPVRAAAVPLDVWRQRALAGGLDEERCATLVAMFRYYERHGFIGNPSVLRWLLGQPPASFREVVERTMGSKRR